MNRLLKIEIRKIKNNTSFWVLMGLYGLLFFLTVFVIQSAEFNFNMNGNDLSGNIRQFMGFPYTWQNITYLATFFRWLPAILVIIVIGNEFTYRTFKQSVINGMSREEFITSKILLIALFSVVTTVLVFVVALFVGLMNSEDSSKMLVDFSYIPAFALGTFGYLLFAAFLVFYLKNSVLPIALIFGYTLIDKFTWIMGDWDHYFPLKVLNRLNAFPYKDDVNQLVPNLGFEAPLVYIQDVGLALAWSILFGLLLFWKARRMDIR